jgi:metal-responsive CopG/Arc/MetJ family transcriptional regulator
MPRIGIVIPNKLLNLVDYHSKINGYSRSEFIRHALREIIEKKGENEAFREIHNSINPHS